MSGRDIVERLRDGAPCDIGRRGACVPSCVWCDAAAEIERLRALVPPDRPACWVAREFSLAAVPGLSGGKR